MKRSRIYLKEKFEDGDRPTGVDFEDLIDSFVSKVDENLQLDGNGNLMVPNGINLANTANGQAGTIRYNGGNVEVFDGAAWNPINGGGGGAFVPVGGSSDVAYGGGNVGVGTFVSPPTFKLEVPLANNTGPSEQVRFGNTVVHNGTDDAAYLGHQGAGTAAVKQELTGNSTFSAAAGRVLRFSQGATSRMTVNGSGEFTINPASNVTVNGNLIVTGQAFKPGGGTFQALSDKRLKKDVKELETGLNEILKLTPVNYKYNGKGGTKDDGKEYVGLIAQEVAKVVPSMVSKMPASSDNEEMSDLLTLDTNPLMFMMLNAIKELSERVDKLESALASKATRKA